MAGDTGRCCACTTYDPLARGAHGNSLEHKAARAILFLAAHETVLAWIGNNLGTSSALRRSSLLDSRRYEAIASERLGEECSAKGSCIFRANQADVTHRKSDDRGCITVGHGLISPQDRNEGRRIGAGRPVMPALADALSIAYASLWHFLMKLVLAAPASGLPFLSMAFGSQTSLAHFVMKLFKAAPASGLPSLPIALLWQRFVGPRRADRYSAQQERQTQPFHEKSPSGSPSGPLCRHPSPV